MRYLFALLLAAALIAAMFTLAAGVRASWETAAPGDSAQQWTGGQLLLISLARTIDRWAWLLAAAIVLVCLATAALCRPTTQQQRHKEP